MKPKTWEKWCKQGRYEGKLLTKGWELAPIEWLCVSPVVFALICGIREAEERCGVHQLKENP